jgi:polar amino acid transport system substrate-binding protein
LALAWQSRARTAVHMQRSMTMQRYLATTMRLAAFVVVALATACAPSAQDPGTSKLYEVQKRGKLIVGVTSEVPPFGFIGPDGQMQGFDIDIAKIIAKGLFEGSDNIEFKKTAFAARWTAANSGEIDFGIMVTTIWPDRLARINFTRGYIRSGMSVLSRDDVKVSGIQDFNKPDYTMAILDTPSEYDLMKANLPAMKTLVLASEADMLTAVRTGRAQALLIDAPVAAWRAGSLPSLKNWGIIGPLTQDAIFMRQNDFQWWYYLDAMVGEMRCGSLYEDYKAAYSKWFKVDPPPPSSCLAFKGED